MQKEYQDVDISVIYQPCSDVITASGDNYEDDPWIGFEY